MSIIIGRRLGAYAQPCTATRRTTHQQFHREHHRYLTSRAERCTNAKGTVLNVEYLNIEYLPGIEEFTTKTSKPAYLGLRVFKATPIEDLPPYLPYWWISQQSPYLPTNQTSSESLRHSASSTHQAPIIQQRAKEKPHSPSFHGFTHIPSSRPRMFATTSGQIQTDLIIYHHG